MLAQCDLLAELGTKLCLDLLTQLVIERYYRGNVQDDDVVLFLQLAVVFRGYLRKKSDFSPVCHDRDELDHVGVEFLERLADNLTARSFRKRGVAQNLGKTRAHANDLLHFLELCRDLVLPALLTCCVEQHLGIRRNLFLDEHTVFRH